MSTRRHGLVRVEYITIWLRRQDDNPQREERVQYTMSASLLLTLSKPMALGKRPDEHLTAARAATVLRPRAQTTPL